MVILQESVSSQTIKVLPNSDTYTSIKVLDELTGEETTIASFTSVIGEYLHSITAIFPTVQERFYTIKIYNGTTLVFYDKIFCTNQTVSSYTIVNGQYITTNTNNDFIIL